MTQTGMLGNRAEKLAHKYLRKQGLTSLAQNYHCRYGEIDLVMRDNDYLVFVEVRYRKNQNYGGAIESVDRFKQAKLRRSAESYLLKSKNHDCPCRFDILCITGNLNKPELDWIKNAF